MTADHDQINLTVVLLFLWVLIRVIRPIGGFRSDSLLFALAIIFDYYV